MPVTLKGLPVQDLRKEVRGVGVRVQVLDRHHARAAHLPQLEQLAVDVPRVLCRCVPMAKVVSSFVVGLDADGLIALTKAASPMAEAYSPLLGTSTCNTSSQHYGTSV